MKRIDTINAREDVNGVGKKGFHDNADLSGQDATYISPDWLNHIQEELANILEKNSVALDSNVRDQLFQLLATKADIDDLATATQGSIDNLASNVEADLSNKYDKTGGTITGDALITGGLTVQTSLLLGSFLAAQNGYTPLPNGLILQWGKVSDDFAIYNFPIEFPNAAFALIGQQISGGGSSKVYVEIISKSQFKVFEGSGATAGTEFYWFAIGV
ncbi:gp53-like domain-containing protein [Acinetobacter junii]|uniref:gp53-like domain-containing protein n=1 Tax=Acinetobacter junii TaxID=40215 RepID=UPI0021D22FD9|nr:hypothetical protein [Acinetobacter junii]